jgi:hypothetical protein
MRKSVKKTAKKAGRKTTTRRVLRKNSKPVERRVSAKRLIPRIEALEKAVADLATELRGHKRDHDFSGKWQSTPVEPMAPPRRDADSDSVTIDLGDAP